MKCRRFITKRQGHLWYAAKRAFTWAAAIFADSGRFAPLQSPTAWTFSYPPRLTVDDGRESKMELDELRTGSRNMDEVLGARGLTEDEFYETRAWSIAKRKAAAIRIAREASEKYAETIEIEDREMFMQTPNEVPETEAPDKPNTNSPNEPDPD